MKRSATRMTMTLLLSTLLAGCSSMDAEHQQRTRALGYNTVVFTDYDLNREFSKRLTGPNDVIRITAPNHGLEKTGTGTSEVWVELRNHTDYDYMLEARTRFFSEKGAPTRAEPVWRRVGVPANTVATYRAKSVSSESLKYRVEVRQAE